MAGVLGIYSGAGYNLPAQCVLFSPVPGLLFVEQPAYCYSYYCNYVQWLTFTDTAANALCF
jgi:hypothetical protein